ncbi:MAG TPA: hypothetical protein VII00_08535 [bacterium]
MDQGRVNTRNVIRISAIIAGILFITESLFRQRGDGSLLLTLLFWKSLVDGCIAFVAAAELSKGKWILPVKNALLSFYPMLFVLSVFFIFLLFQVDIYPWYSDGGVWFNKNFFGARNFIILLILYVAGRKFAIESRREGNRKNFYAVIFLFFFVVSQSMVAFDWVMPLEYPWYSTLFGGYHFVESLYSGIAVAAILCFIISRKAAGKNIQPVGRTLFDTATMLFGFSLLWAGLFYSQYLVIWYGNLPEEISFLVKRISLPYMRTLSYSILIELFAVPFLILLSRRVKSNPPLVFITALVVLTGIFTERLVYLLPAVSLDPLRLLIQFAGIGTISILIHKNKIINSSS